MEAGNGVQAKGTGILSGTRWLKERHGERGYRKVLGAMSPEVRRAYEDLLVTDWYPVRYLDELWACVARELYDDEPARVGPAMEEQGKFIAEDNLSTVFRVLLIFVGSPEQLFRSFPRFWRQYFEGVEVELDDSAVDDGRGSVRVHHLGELRHVSPVACGWTRYGMLKVGASEIEVEEETYASATPCGEPLVFHLSWS